MNASRAFRHAILLLAGVAASSSVAQPIIAPSPAAASLRHDSNRMIIQDAQPDAIALEEPKVWQFSATPYFWTAGMDGESTAKGTTTDIDVGFDDIIDNFDVVAVPVHLEGWHAPSGWGFVTDFNYLSLDGTFPTPDPTVTVNVQLDQLLFEAAVGYRLIDPDRVEPDTALSDSALGLVVYGGLRYMSLDLDIDLNPGPVVSDTDSWLQPYAGARIRYEFDNDLALFSAGDFGHWEDGDDESTIWNVLVGVDWRAWTNVSLKGGYHWQGVDVSSGKGGGFGQDLIVSGPTVGITIYW